MSIKVAKLFSYILHPVLLPSFIVICFYFFAPLSSLYGLFSIKSFISILLIIFVYTALFPSVMIYWMYKRKAISDIELSQQAERPKIYFISSAFYLSLAYFLYTKGGLLLPTAYLLLCMSLNIIGLGLFSFKIKISAHASAIAGLIGIIGVIYTKYYEQALFIPLLCFIILAGIIGTSRLKLNAHTLKEVWLGYAWGLVSSILLLNFLV